jgi:hypothetical protein
MIEIINDKGQVLDLDSSFSLTIERNNPLFLRDDEFFQDITYPGKTPLTDNNKLFIGGGHLAERTIYNYELPVHVYIDNVPFFSGTLAYDIQGGDINFVLKVGYGDIAEKCEMTYLQELDYGGSVQIPYSEKQDSLVNPENYPFVFFPIFHNTTKVEELDEAGTPIQYFTNFYNFAEQKLHEWADPQARPWLELPHFKLTYVLSEACRFLGLTAVGSFFTDPYIKSLHIQNLQFQRPPRTYAKYAVPHITITDLLKALKSRFKVNISFNLMQKEAVFSAPNTLLNSTDYIDISKHVTAIGKILAPERLTYTVKSDQQSTEYNPPNYIEIKDPFAPALAEEEVLVSVSTLPVETYTADGYSYPVTTLPFLTGRAINPNADQVLWRTPYDSARHSAIRLLSYTGLKDVSVGKKYPTAEPVEFKLSDGEWYAFLNDAKIIQLTALLPNHLLSRITPFDKVGFITEQNLFMVGVIKKMEYSLTSSTSGLVDVTFEILSRMEHLSKVSLVANELVPEENTGRKRVFHGRRPRKM